MTRRVAHVLRKYDASEWGGTETHVCEVTRRLLRHGYESEVHAPAGPTSGAGALEVPLVRYRAFLPVLGVRKSRRALFANAGNIASFDEPMRLLADGTTDLAHLHTMGRIGGAVRTAMRVTRRPYVVSVHGPFLANQEWLEADTRQRMKRVIDLGKPIGFLFGARRVVDDAARVITFNEEERRAIAERIGDRAVRMDHGVDVARLSSGDLERARARWPELAHGKVIALVGRLCAQKNQVLAVRAFKEGAPSDYQLVLAGAATDHGYRERIEREARRLGVRDRVRILGNLDSRTEVPDLYALAELLVVTSSHEAFGLIVLEGWASGTPVLFPRHSGMTDIADALSHDDAAVPSLEPEAWAGAIRRALSDDGIRRANVEAGRALVRRRYNWDAVAGKLAEVYETVLEEQRGMPRPRPQQDPRWADEARP